jgi:hypothetical protein
MSLINSFNNSAFSSSAILSSFINKWRYLSGVIPSGLPEAV